MANQAHIHWSSNPNGTEYAAGVRGFRINRNKIKGRSRTASKPAGMLPPDNWDGWKSKAPRKRGGAK